MTWEKHLKVWRNWAEIRVVTPKRFQIVSLRLPQMELSDGLGGQIDVSKRLGCMCCPLASRRKRIIEFQKYPKIAKAYLRAGQRFMETHPDSKACQRYDNVYEWFTRDVFYSSNADWNKVSTGLFGKPDFKKFLEDKFGIDLTL